MNGEPFALYIKPHMVLTRYFLTSLTSIEPKVASFGCRGKYAVRIQIPYQNEMEL